MGEKYTTKELKKHGSIEAGLKAIELKSNKSGFNEKLDKALESEQPRTEAIEATLTYPPSLNRLYRVSGKGIRLSKAGTEYKKTIRKELIKIKKQFKGKIKIWVDAYRPAKRGDLDNTLKALLDSMQGICYADDKQIVEIHARRFDDKENPRVEIKIETWLSFDNPNPIT